MIHFAAVRIIVATIAAAGATAAARAQDASAWDGDLHAAARLIGGGPASPADAKLLRAGIEIRLDPGWKTYWRYPGDSGAPPTLDFGGSENVNSVEILWPAPKRFADGAGGESIGYSGDLVLPLRVIRQDASKPSLLHVKLGYDVCGNLCVPAQANLDLKLIGAAGGEEPALLAAERRVPQRLPLGEVKGDVGIRALHREPGGEHERVVVDVFVPDGVPVDLFAEGPAPDWSLPLPKPEPSASGDPPGVRRFSFDLDGLPPGASARGAVLTLTAVSASHAIEVQARLD